MKYKKLNEALANEIETVEPGRLLSLLGQALKWQKRLGTLPSAGTFDLFAGKTPEIKRDDDSVPTFQYATIKVSLYRQVVDVSFQRSNTHK